MKVGDLVKAKCGTQPLGIVTKVNKRDLSFYRSHTYLVRFFAFSGDYMWLQDYEMEVVCE